MPLWRSVSFLWFAGLMLISLAWAQTEERGEERSAMITALEGKAMLLRSQQSRPLTPFERLAPSDQITLESGRVTLLYFLSGRQESYQGSGRIEIGVEESNGIGFAPTSRRRFAPEVVKQLARSASLLSQERTSGSRMRAIATPEAIAKVESTYKRLRMEAAADDLTPEMYRLSALYEMRALDALALALKELEMLRPHHNEARLLVSLYRKALKNG